MGNNGVTDDADGVLGGANDGELGGQREGFYQRDVAAEYEALNYDANKQFDDNVM